jgi:hypothetical protein
MVPRGRHRPVRLDQDNRIQLGQLGLSIDAPQSGVEVLLSHGCSKHRIQPGERQGEHFGALHMPDPHKLGTARS